MARAWTEAVGCVAVRLNCSRVIVVIGIEGESVNEPTASASWHDRGRPAGQIEHRNIASLETIAGTMIVMQDTGLNNAN